MKNAVLSALSTTVFPYFCSFSMFIFTFLPLPLIVCLQKSLPIFLLFTAICSLYVLWICSPFSTYFAFLTYSVSREKELPAMHLCLCSLLLLSFEEVMVGGSSMDAAFPLTLPVVSHAWITGEVLCFTLGFRKRKGANWEQWAQWATVLLVPLIGSGWRMPMEVAGCCWGPGKSESPHPRGLVCGHSYNG